MKGRPPESHPCERRPFSLVQYSNFFHLPIHNEKSMADGGRIASVIAGSNDHLIVVDATDPAKPVCFGIGDLLIFSVNECAGSMGPIPTLFRQLCRRMIQTWCQYPSPSRSRCQCGHHPLEIGRLGIPKSNNLSVHSVISATAYTRAPCSAGRCARFAARGPAHHDQSLLP
jgi:hypothetical protein